MKDLMLCVGALVVGLSFAGCATKGLTEAAKNDVPTALWYENATLLVDANDPDLKADAKTGIPSIDDPVNTVKDLIAIVPIWTVTKVEEKHFHGMYMESAKALNSGADGADFVVKGECFKTALLMDTFAEEIAHANAALKMRREVRYTNYVENGKVYENAANKAAEYANNQVFVFESCVDDAARKAFFAEASRKKWDLRTDEIVQKLKACMADADKEDVAKANIDRLCREMGVQEVDWASVALKLSEDLSRLKTALSAVIVALGNRELAEKIALASTIGTEIVPGTPGKETLSAINRVQKQLTVSIRLTGWLMKSVID